MRAQDQEKVGGQRVAIGACTARPETYKKADRWLVSIKHSTISLISGGHSLQSLALLSASVWNAVRFPSVLSRTMNSFGIRLFISRSTDHAP